MGGWKILLENGGWTKKWDGLSEIEGRAVFKKNFKSVTEV